MRTTLRALWIAAAATLFGAGAAYAHPGHVTHGSLFQSMAHVLRSPYHLAVLVAVVLLAAAWGVALRSRAAVHRAAAEDERAG